MKEDEITNAIGPTVDADTREILSAVLTVVRDLENKVDGLNGIVEMQQAAIHLLGQAIHGHQKVLEQSQPETAPGSPKPPNIVH